MGTLFDLDEEDSDDQALAHDFEAERAAERMKQQATMNDAKLHEIEKNRLEEEIKNLIKQKKDKDS